MKNENGMPGHSTIKELVFDRIYSQEYFQAMERPNVSFAENNTNEVTIFYDGSQYGTDELEALKKIIGKQHKALVTAEEQLVDILTEDPFIPEEFGFALIHAPETIHESPIRLYESRFHPGMTIHRPIDPLDGTHDNSIWTITMKKDDGTFITSNLKLPCHRIAYAAFYALGIQVEEEAEQEAAEEAPVVITPAKENSKTNMFDVVFHGFGDHTIEQIPAYTEKDAIAAAKFMVETDHEKYGLEMGAVTDFEQYSITK